MKTSNFDTLITIEKKVSTPDPDYGTPVITWVPLAYLPGSPAVTEKFWAEVQDVLPSKSESVQQGLAMARNQTRIRLRYRNDIDSTMRVTVHRDTDVVYQIVGGPAEIGGRKQKIELMCEKYSTDPNAA